MSCDVAPGVPPGTQTRLVEAANIGGQLVLRLHGGRVDNVQIISKEVVDLLLVGVQLLAGLLENVADKELHAVGGVCLVHGFEEGTKVVRIDLPFAETQVKFVIILNE